MAKHLITFDVKEPDSVENLEIHNDLPDPITPELPVSKPVQLRIPDLSAEAVEERFTLFETRFGPEAAGDSTVSLPLTSWSF